ncbi:MAG: radical SAM protein [Ardenticatenaceae bacterium]|nr:radical SAM protein [Ardenticatenaceae bacterium]
MNYKKKIPHKNQNLFVSPILDKNLIYAPLHGTAILLQNAQLKNPSPAASNALQALLSPPTKAPTTQSGKLVPPFLGILPTRGCNLACAYCGFFSPDQTDKMSFKVAEQAVRWYLNTLQEAGQTHGEIHFFGGEPFCAPEIVEFVVHLSQKLAAHLNITLTYAASTNGIYPADRARWIADHIDSIVLSFDGPEEIQNHHRAAPNEKGSYAIVRRTAEIFSQHATKFCLRACITDETVTSMSQIARWFCQNFRPDAISFEPLQPSQYSEPAGLYPPDPWSFAQSFIDAAQIVESYGIEIVYATADIDNQRITFCPVAQDVVIVSPDGRLSACYLLPEEWQAKGLDLDIGRIHHDRCQTIEIDRIAVERVRQHNVLNKPLCQTCFAKWHCAGGCHVNHQIGTDYDRLCIQNRIITLWRILQAMGTSQLAEQWLSDLAEVQKTILQPSDLLVMEES